MIFRPKVSLGLNITNNITKTLLLMSVTEGHKMLKITCLNLNIKTQIYIERLLFYYIVAEYYFRNTLDLFFIYCK